jgi:hypothetical protein
MHRICLYAVRCRAVGRGPADHVLLYGLVTPVAGSVGRPARKDIGVSWMNRRRLQRLVWYVTNEQLAVWRAVLSKEVLFADTSGIRVSVGTGGLRLRPGVYEVPDTD